VTARTAQRACGLRAAPAAIVIVLVTGCVQSPPRSATGVETGSPTSAAHPSNATRLPAASPSAGNPAPAEPADGQPALPPEPGPATIAVTRALGVIGRPYRLGGSSPTGFDCSGLVHYSFGLAGVPLPRTTGEQRLGTRRLVTGESMDAGDLVFFTRGKSALHVGILAGERRFVHAATRGGGVRVDSLDAPHWQTRFIEVRRVDPARGRGANR